MNYKLIIYAVLFVSFNCLHSQNNNNSIMLNSNVIDYFIGNQRISIIEHTIENSNNINYWFWFSKGNLSCMSDTNKIREHFFIRKADTSLFQLSFESDMIFFPELFTSFTKIIKPNEKFTIYFVSKRELKTNEKELITNQLCDYLIIYSEPVLLGYFKNLEKISKSIFYKESAIIIPIETIL